MVVLQVLAVTTVLSTTTSSRFPTWAGLTPFWVPAANRGTASRNRSARRSSDLFKWEKVWGIDRKKEKKDGKGNKERKLEKRKKEWINKRMEERMKES